MVDVLSLVTVPAARMPLPRRSRRNVRTCFAAAAATACLLGGTVAAAAAPALEAPAANPDILVNMDGDLYLVRPDGTRNRRLTTSGDIGGASFSPDRSRIVYSQGTGRVRDIYVMKSDGTGAINLTATPDVEEGSPDWSPDGTRIVFHRYWQVDDDVVHAIAIMPARKGATHREVTRDDIDIRGCHHPSYSSAVWSPTRTEIAIEASCSNPVGRPSSPSSDRPALG